MLATGPLPPRRRARVAEAAGEEGGHTLSLMLLILLRTVRDVKAGSSWSFVLRHQRSTGTHASASPLESAFPWPALVPSPNMAGPQKEDSHQHRPGTHLLCSSSFSLSHFSNSTNSSWTWTRSKTECRSPSPGISSPLILGRASASCACAPSKETTSLPWTVLTCCCSPPIDSN